ncbi:MAG: hypothetical protein Q8M03_13645 [Legionella sp.]|nr:hypothetical protein [Legionella sp.]
MLGEKQDNGLLLPAHKQYQEEWENFLKSMEKHRSDFLRYLAPLKKTVNQSLLRTLSAVYASKLPKIDEKIQILRNHTASLNPPLTQEQSAALTESLVNLSGLLNEEKQFEEPRRQFEELINTQRIAFQNLLDTLKDKLPEVAVAPPSSLRVFFSYSWGIEVYTKRVHRLAKDLRKLGFDVKLDIWDNTTGSVSVYLEYIDSTARVKGREVKADVILVMCTPDLTEKWQNYTTGGLSRMETGSDSSYRNNILSQELLRIQYRVSKEPDESSRIFPIILGGKHTESVPTFLQQRATLATEMSNGIIYYRALMNLIQAIYFNNSEVIELTNSLYRTFYEEHVRFGASELQQDNQSYGRAVPNVPSPQPSEGSSSRRIPPPFVTHTSREKLTAFIAESKSKLKTLQSTNASYMGQIRELLAQSRLYLFGAAPAEEFATHEDLTKGLRDEIHHLSEYMDDIPQENNEDLLSLQAQFDYHSQLLMICYYLNLAMTCLKQRNPDKLIQTINDLLAAQDVSTLDENPSPLITSAELQAICYNLLAKAYRQKITPYKTSDQEISLVEENYLKAVEWSAKAGQTDNASISSLAAFYGDVELPEKAWPLHQQVLGLLPPKEALVSTKDTERWAVSHSNAAWCQFQLAIKEQDGLKQRRAINQALLKLDLSIEVHPNGGTYLYQGLIHHKLGDLDKALFCFNNGLKQEPHNIKLRLARAECYLASGMKELAEQDAIFVTSQAQPTSQRLPEYQYYYDRAELLLDEVDKLLSISETTVLVNSGLGIFGGSVSDSGKKPFTQEKEQKLRK